jgi:hypothetical protein
MQRLGGRQTPAQQIIAGTPHSRLDTHESPGWGPAASSAAREASRQGGAASPPAFAQPASSGRGGGGGGDPQVKEPSAATTTPPATSAASDTSTEPTRRVRSGAGSDVACSGSLIPVVYALSPEPT